ncbi:hypothetical protein FXO38_12981 [Capsicum annuum]|nr:hypothetical protein FXO38_12981 [Capsicum annuum]KAF3661623.1 hypothetical protein FXO37_12849 [Capsicum annuum]
MSSTCVLKSSDDGKNIDDTQYRGVIGSLLYLTASQPDILFSVCKYARFQSAPKESHLTAVKHIIKYLIGSNSNGLWYPKSNGIVLKVSQVQIMQCYNTTSFARMGYILVDDVWVRKSESSSVATPSSPKLNSYPLHYTFGTTFVDVKLYLFEIDSKLDNLKDLFLATHLQHDKIKNTSKEAGTDVALLCVKLDQVIKESTKLVRKT